MSTPLAFLPLVAPLALASVAVLARLEPGVRPRRVLAASRAATILALVASAAFAVLTAELGPTTVQLDLGPIAPSFRFDALAAVMTALVASLGAAVVGFSRNYLAGDARHGTFLGRLCLTIAAVLVLVASGGLVQLALAWVATSLALHRLLLFYPERRGAVIAARKKFVVARLGDACLVAAVALLVRAFGTTDIAQLGAAAREARALGAVPLGVHAAALLVVASAALKSAQFPTHGWLAEVMETPTPVSALLHAGILNGGTFLVVRLSDVVVAAPSAMALMVVVGGFTAAFASVVMVTQPRVKVSLACSSAAHMGFMLLLCGMGAFTVAILHLVAHSFYKAHAFLSSGSAVDVARASRETKAPRAVSPGVALVSLGIAVAVYIAVGLAMGVHVADHPVMIALGAMLVLALAHLVAQGMAGRARGVVVARTTLAAAATALAFFGLERVAAHVLHPAIVVAPEPGATTMVLAAVVVLGFAVVTVLQLVLPARPTSPFWRAAWVHARNGFYANAVFDRLVGALRR